VPTDALRSITIVIGQTDVEGNFLARYIFVEGFHLLLYLQQL